MARTTLFNMHSDKSTEGLAVFIGKRFKKVLGFVVLLSVLISAFNAYYRSTQYVAQNRFYITSSESVNYKSILEKEFIDISVNPKDLLRIESFANSNMLLSILKESILNQKENFDTSAYEQLNSLTHISDWFEVSFTDLGEVELTVEHSNRVFADFLVNEAMHGINNLNNDFLASFKKNQINASKKQLTMLNKKKLSILDSIDQVSRLIKSDDYSLLASQLKTQFNKGNLNSSSIEAYLMQRNSPEQLRLMLLFQKLKSLDDQIELFSRNQANDNWSLEMLKNKTPFVTQSKPAKSKFSWYNTFISFLMAFLLSLSLGLFVMALRFQYDVYFKLLLS